MKKKDMRDIIINLMDDFVTTIVNFATQVSSSPLFRIRRWLYHFLQEKYWSLNSWSFKVYDNLSDSRDATSRRQSRQKLQHQPILECDLTNLWHERVHTCLRAWNGINRSSSSRMHSRHWKDWLWRWHFSPSHVNHERLQCPDGHRQTNVLTHSCYSRQVQGSVWQPSSNSQLLHQVR